MNIYSNKQSDLTERIFTLQLISVVLTTSFSIWTLNSLVSIMVALNFVLTTVLLVNEFFKRSNTGIIWWILIICISFFSAFVRISRPTFEAFKLWLMFVSTINLFYWVSIVDITEQMLKNFFKYTTFMAIVFVVAALNDRLYANDKFTYVTFGLANPNQTALYLLNIFLVLSLHLRFLENKFVKILYLAIIVFCGYYICMTESRACIIAGSLYLLFYFRKTKRFNAIFNFFAILFPLIFVFMYLNNVASIRLSDFFDFLISEGKSLSSREYIWKNAIGLIKDYPLLGNYLKGGNMHNIHLSVMVNHGNIVFVLFILFLNFLTIHIGKEAKYPYQFVALYAFYTVLISGTFEGALVSGSQGMYVFSVCLLLVAKYDIDKAVPEENPLNQQMLT